MVTEEVRAALATPLQAVVDMAAYQFTSRCRICRTVRARAASAG
jgi:hypothetical protein